MGFLDKMFAEFVDVIEKQRVQKNMTQSDLYQSAGMSSTAYANFISKKSTSFENIVKLMFALDMRDKLEYLLVFEAFDSLDEIRAQKNKKIKKRVRKG